MYFLYILLKDGSISPPVIIESLLLAFMKKRCAAPNVILYIERRVVVGLASCFYESSGSKLYCFIASNMHPRVVILDLLTSFHFKPGATYS